MYEDKTLICKDCGNEFVFTAGSMPKKVSRMNRNAAKHAASHAKTLQNLNASSLLPPAQNAAAKRKFPSVRLKAETYIAATASRR